MSKRRWIAVAAGAAIVVIGVLLGVFLTGGPDPSSRDAAVDVAIEGEPSGTTGAAGDEEGSASASPDAASPDAATPDIEAPGARDAGEDRQPAGEAEGTAAEGGGAPVPPRFDVVRVNPQGEAVIAGRSTPGARVTVRDGSEEIGSTIANRRGEWVLVPDKPLRGGAHALSAVETTEGGATVESEDVVVLSVPERDDAQAGTLVVKAPHDGAGASRVLQRPGQAASDRPAEGEAGTGPEQVPGEGIRDGTEGTLVVESVDYGEEGNVVIAGKAEPRDTVRVYVDDRHVGTIEAGEEGDWEVAPGDRLPPGEHTLRVDRVDREGIVLARIETPLVRVGPEDIPFGDAIVVVQPGNSLWRIARRTLGGGVHYTMIYEANRSQIRDPTLIYPGQIFTVPRRD